MNSFPLLFQMITSMKYLFSLCYLLVLVNQSASRSIIHAPSLARSMFLPANPVADPFYDLEIAYLAQPSSVLGGHVYHQSARSRRSSRGFVSQGVFYPSFLSFQFPTASFNWRSAMINCKIKVTLICSLLLVCLATGRPPSICSGKSW